MIWATWILALASLVTAVTDVAVTIRHTRNDNLRFHAHAQRLNRNDARLRKLEDGGDRM